jgi:hypothetical protein
MYRFQLALFVLTIALAALAGQILWGDAIMWGTLDGDQILWGTLSSGDAIVWGT